VSVTYEYPRPAVTVDVVIFTIRNGQLAVLLIRRGKAPFRGFWALPGGFVDASESLEHAAARELHEETGLTGMRLEQLGAFGDPGRDPRGHTVSVAYFAFAVSAGTRGVRAGDDAVQAEWQPVAQLGLGDVAQKGALKLAFDHHRILSRALGRLQQEASRLGPSNVVDFAPPRFTLGELQHVYEAVIGHTVDKRNFRARLLAQKIVEPAATERRTGRHRPAQLYHWVMPKEIAPTVEPSSSRAKTKKTKRKPKKRR
jgi:8-oxo-dGTP diphosphatase